MEGHIHEGTIFTGPNATTETKKMTANALYMIMRDQFQTKHIRMYTAPGVVLARAIQDVYGPQEAHHAAAKASVSGARACSDNTRAKAKLHF